MLIEGAGWGVGEFTRIVKGQRERRGVKDKSSSFFRFSENFFSNLFLNLFTGVRSLNRLVQKSLYFIVPQKNGLKNGAEIIKKHATGVRKP
jgi:hypothetical protein